MMGSKVQLSRAVAGAVLRGYTSHPHRGGGAIDTIQDPEVKPVPVEPDGPVTPGFLRRVVPALLWAFVLCGLTLHYKLQHVPAPWIWVLLVIPAWFGYLAAPYGRFENRERYRGTRWRVWMGLFLSVGLFCGHMLAALTVMAQDGRPAVDLSISWLVAAAMATCASAMFAVLIARLRGDEGHSLGFVAQDLGASVWAGLQVGLLFLALDLITYKFTQTMDFWQLGGMNAVRVVFETNDPWLSAIAAFVGVALVPFAEEVLFRGVLFAALRRTCGVLSGVVISAAIFGVFHVPGWQMPFVLGLLLAYLYHRTGSLWASVAAHMMVNLAALGLGFNRGAALRYLSWTHVGGFVILIGVLLLIRRRRTAAAACACGFAAVGSAERCPDCAYPLTELPLAVTRTGRGLLFLVMLAAGGACVVFDYLATRPFTPGASNELLSAQYELLRSTGREAQAGELLKAWRAHDETAPGPTLVLAREAYLREDYAQIVRLVEPLALSKEPEKVHYARLAKNMLALALAELGGPRGNDAVQYAREVWEGTPEEARKPVEDTLGWALLRVGEIEQAREYLDRELTVYGLQTRADVAELAYHRGVLLWSIGEEERARQVLALAAQQVPPIQPYTRRALAILERGALPDGLVPLLPPPLPEIRKNAHSQTVR